MRILIVTDSLSIGGTAKSLIGFLQRAMEKHAQAQFTLICLDSENSLISQVPPGVSIHYAHKKYSNIRNVRIMRVVQNIVSTGIIDAILCRLLRSIRPESEEENLRKIMYRSQRYSEKQALLYKPEKEEYDVAISWTEMTAMYYLVNRAHARVKISWIHPNYLEAGFSPRIDEKYIGKIDFIASVSKKNRDDLRTAFPMLKNKALAIYNCIDREKINRMAFMGISDSAWKKGVFHLVTVCRLHNQSKALFRAISVCKRLDVEGLDFQWIFVGDGPDKIAADRANEKEGLKDRLAFIGYRENPYPYMKEADLFVLQSYYEGKPLVIDEALCLGIPVLVTDYTSANEQVTDGVDGWIVKNEENAIYQKLKAILQNREMVNNMRRIAKGRPAETEDDTDTLDMLCNYKG